MLPGDGDPLVSVDAEVAKFFVALATLGCDGVLAVVAATKTRRRRRRWVRAR